MDINIFLGRFHPLVVHLPIGFLLLAVIMYVLSIAFENHYKKLDHAVSISLLLGAVSSAVATVLGLLLAGSGGYEGDALFGHKWLGIGLTFFSFIVWAIKSEFIKISRTAFNGILGLLVLLISLTGHLGGSLTHGSDYLISYAPSFIKNMLGHQSKILQSEKIPTDVDSVLLFTHLIQPILNTKCISCHNESKAKGGLVITTYQGIQQGGDNGKVIIPGKSMESSLFSRTTLLHDNPKFMPPKGTPLSYGEMKLIEWWINTGAYYDKKLTQKKISGSIQAILMRDYKLNTKPKSFIEKVKVPSLTAEDFKRLTEAGLKATLLSNEQNFIEVKANSKKITEKQMRELLLVKEQITRLDLNNKSITDEMLASIGKLKNLTRLKLAKNPITDDGIKHLDSLVNLESLNLYGTLITNKSLFELKKITSLKRIYTWQTKVTYDVIEEINKISSGLKIYTGI